MSFNELSEDTAMLKLAYRYLNTDFTEDIEVFLEELKEKIINNEMAMKEYDKWLDQKEQEVLANIDSQWEDAGPRKEEGEDW